MATKTVTARLDISYADAARALVLAKVDRYRAAARVSDSTVGRRSKCHSGFVATIRRGEGVTLDKLARLEEWLNANIPAAEAEAAPPRRAAGKLAA